jgi:aspartate carbamoyltransferase catalytic subunit
LRALSDFLPTCRQQLPRELLVRVQRDRPVNETSLETDLRDRLDKIDRSVVVTRRRGLEVFHPLPVALQIEWHYNKYQH